MKRLFLLLMPLLLATACNGVPNDDVTPGGDQIPAVIAQFDSFKFLKACNGEAILSDVTLAVEKGKVAVCSPMIRSTKSLVATFSTDAERVYVGDTEQVSGQTANDFTSPVTYRLVSSTGDESLYTVTVSDTGLPVVIINTPGKRVIPPKTEDWLEDTELKIFLPDGTTDFDGVVNIRGRGNSTWTFPKKPYAIKLNEKASILGMPKHKRWVLLANWLDRSSMRNHIAFHIARQTDLEWTPRGEFVEVVLNGKHKGCYYLCEQIKVDKNRVNIAELTDEEPSGGYLMELDVYFDEVFKFHSPSVLMPFMFKDPDEVTPVQEEYMYNFISVLEESLCDKERFATREYTSYLDVDSFIDWWLVHELTGNAEPMHPKSSYMHKDKDGLLKAGPVWDFDWETFVPYKVNGYVVRDAIYYPYLFADEGFVARLKERWTLLKPRLEQVGAFIESEAARIAPAVEINMKMWPIDVVVNQDEKFTFDNAVSRIKHCYESKLKWLDGQIANM